MSDASNNPEVTEEEVPQQKQRKHPLYWLIPREGYFITPIIIDINILILLIMVACGVNPLLPNPDVLMKWGANSRGVTMYGEPWRMFTCMFLHYGLIHLAVNMWALFSLGRMLEPFIGHWRFLTLYILSGLAASAVSMWYHDNSAAVGASGAIFGVFGIFAALLTTDIIRKDIRSRMLRSILITIGINLIIGLSWHIDNSAHIGGLVAGVIGGYLIYFDLKKFYVKRIVSYLFTIVDVFVIAAFITVFWMITGPSVDPKALAVRFEKTDSLAQAFIMKIDSTTSQQNVLDHYFTPYQKCKDISDTLQKMKDVEDGWHDIFVLYHNYADARFNEAAFLYDHFTQEDSANRDSLSRYRVASDSALAKLNRASIKLAQEQKDDN